VTQSYIGRFFRSNKKTIRCLSTPQGLDTKQHITQKHTMILMMASTVECIWEIDLWLLRHLERQK